MANTKNVTTRMSKATDKRASTSPQIKTVNRKENHIIEGMPYVNQESNFYCSYACVTMILKYYGIDTSLHEVLYTSGVGYDLIYPALNGRYLPIGGTVGCQWSIDREFLASLYNLSYESWIADRTLSIDECWQEYWTKIKQYITNGIPIITTVNPVYFYPISKQTKRVRFDINRVPKLLLDFFPRLMHDIVIVGYDESNQTVCYHDPMIEMRSTIDNGAYIWISLSGFRKAVENATIKNKKANYSIQLFSKISGLPIKKKEVFEKVHNRNIEKMKGTISVYPMRYRKRKLGINALNSLKNELDKGIKDRSNILLSYKCNGLKNRFLHKISKFLIDQYVPEQNFSNLFGWIAYEKENVFQYFEKNNHLLNAFQEEKENFKCEAKNWRILASYFSEFRNIFMTRSDTLNLIKNMSSTIDNILLIEQKIVND